MVIASGITNEFASDDCKPLPTATHFITDWLYCSYGMMTSLCIMTFDLNQTCDWTTNQPCKVDGRNIRRIQTGLSDSLPAQTNLHISNRYEESLWGILIHLVSNIGTEKRSCFCYQPPECSAQMWAWTQKILPRNSEETWNSTEVINLRDDRSEVLIAQRFFVWCADPVSWKPLYRLC